MPYMKILLSPSLPALLILKPGLEGVVLGPPARVGKTTMVPICVYSIYLLPMMFKMAKARPGFWEVFWGGSFERGDVVLPVKGC